MQDSKHNSHNTKLPAPPTSPWTPPPSSLLFTTNLLPLWPENWGHSPRSDWSQGCCCCFPIPLLDTPSTAGCQQGQEQDHGLEDSGDIQPRPRLQPRPFRHLHHHHGSSQRCRENKKSERAGQSLVWYSAHCSWALPALGPISFSQDCFIQKLTMHQWKPLLIFNIF